MPGFKHFLTFLIFLLNIGVIDAQFSEDFSGDLSNWNGDLKDFIINNNQRLQLSAVEAGESILYRQINTSDSMVFEIQLEMDFNPSNNNRLEWIILGADESLEEGYFIELGENGSEDAITFGYKSSGTKEVFSRGLTGGVAEKPNIFLRILYFNQEEWKIYVDYVGERNPVLEISANHFSPLLNQQIYHGIKCNYTSTRRQGFEFDDWNASRFIPDRHPPILQDAYIALKTDLVLIFDEPILESSIGIDDIMGSPNLEMPEEIFFEGNKVIIRYAVLPDNLRLEFFIKSIQDLAGNTGSSYLVEDLFVKTAPAAGNIFISEILFNPKGSGSDYVELFNGSDKFLELQNLEIANTQNNRSEFITESFVLFPNEYVAITEDIMTTEMNYLPPDTALMWQNSLPAFNNDEGNVTILFNDQEIESFDYSESYHTAIISDEDGVSLERISFIAESKDQSNWASAASLVQYGTPGYPNSAQSKDGVNKNTIELRYQNFSPNEDGFRDHLLIDYNFSMPNYVASAMVYTENGQLIKQIINNQTVGISGTISWDGKDNGDYPCRMGIYIIRVIAFNSNGETLEKKLACSLSRNAR